MGIRKYAWAVLATCLINAVPAAAALKSWTGAVSSDWFSDGNWSLSGVPADGDTVTIPSAGTPPLLTNSTAALAALTVSSGTLTCSNWPTVIRAQDVTVQSTGVINLPVAFTNASMSNRLHIVCSNLTVEAGGKIEADRAGYAIGCGPGKGGGNDRVGGAGYGGQGGHAWFTGEIPGAPGGGTYGSESAPGEPGSAGPVAYSGNTSGTGGGVIRIEADAGTVTVNGTLSANGGNATEAHAGGGSGGSIHITCRTFTGTAAGLVSAQGGRRGEGDVADGGAGGGGRIAIIYQTCNLPSVRLSAAAGVSYFTDGDERFGAGMGTVYLSTADVLTAAPSGISGRLAIPGFSSWSPASLTVGDGAVGLGDGFQLTVAGDLSVTGAATRLRLGTAAQLRCGGNVTVSAGKLMLDSNSTVACRSATVKAGQFVVKGDLTSGTDVTVTNGGAFYVYGGATNGQPLDYGCRVVVTGDLRVAASSWVYPESHLTDGGAPLFQAGNVSVAAGAGISAAGRGYGVGEGPGKPTLTGGYWDNTTGGSHAGKGGKGANNYPPGPCYGSSNAPLTSGSGGGLSYFNTDIYSGRGGGQVRLEVASLLTLDGALNASGADSKEGHAAGGAGGSVFVIARRFESAPGSTIYARGGDGMGNGGAGGGGRIAVWVGPDRTQVYDYVAAGRGPTERYEKFSGTASVTNGTGYYNGPPDGADPGTLVLLQIVKRGTVVIIR